MSSAGQSNSGGIASFLQGIPAPTTQSTSTTYPLWLTQAMQQVIGAAGNLAQQPYTQFPGPTVAQPSATTQRAWNLAGSNVGNWQPDVSQAGALTSAAAAPITSSDINTFLNPYQDYITGALNRNLQENVLPGVQDKFVSAGQSRSPQEAEITNRALRDNQIAVGQSLAGGYQGALNSLLQQRQQQAAAGAQFGQLGALNSQLGSVDLSNLAAAGTAQDTSHQANINAALNQFYQQQQYPYQQLSFLSDIMRGLPTQESGTTTQTVNAGQTFAPSPLATYAGTAGLSSGLGGSSTGSLSGLKRGGHVTPRRLAIGGPMMMPGAVPMARGFVPQPGALQQFRMAA